METSSRTTFQRLSHWSATARPSPRRSGLYDQEGLTDGMLFTFPDFVKGMEFFATEVMPKLEGMGLPVGRNKNLVAA